MLVNMLVTTLKPWAFFFRLGTETRNVSLHITNEKNTLASTKTSLKTRHDIMSSRNSITSPIPSMYGMGLGAQKTIKT